jgi:site-specific DNA-adenine methylase
MKPFFSYFGAKWRLARWYPIPDLKEPFVEPFAGAAGYSTYWEARQAVLVEKDPRVAGVWDYLIKTPAEEILCLPDLPADGCVEDLQICQEAKHLIGFWLACGRAEPAKRWSAWNLTSMKGGFRYSHNPLIWGPRVRARLAEQVAKIRDWRVICASWDSVDYPGRANWLVDPPYTLQGHTYKHHSVDYPRLGEWCRTREGLLVVCEGPEATWLPFEPFRLQLGTNGKNREKRRQEYYWVRRT